MDNVKHAHRSSCNDKLMDEYISLMKINNPLKNMYISVKYYEIDNGRVWNKCYKK